MNALALLFATTLFAPGPQEKVSLDLRESPPLDLHARWDRVTDSVYGFADEYALVRDLEPAAETALHPSADFAPFLPDHAVRVGELWPVDVEAVLPILRQLHAGATQEMHHDRGFGVSAMGGYACLRASGDAFSEIRFRLHADFRISGTDRPNDSSWFTPAQLRGRLVLDRVRGAVVAFELEIPDQTANVDLNVAAEGGVLADIGRVPSFELRGGSFGDFPDATPQISVSEAERLLERAFYPLARIEWLDLATALARSRETGKPMHVVALFGSLLDESC